MDKPPDFAALMSPKDFETLCANGRRAHFPAGTEIYNAGERGESFLVIETGVVAISVVALDGRRTVLSHLGASQIVGELALLDRGVRSASAFAVGDVTGTTVNFTNFRSFLMAHPDIHFAFTSSLCARLRNANAALEDRTSKEGPRRMARCLLRLAQVSSKEESDGSKVIPIKLTQGEIGDVVGLTRANVNRILRTWSDAGVVHWNDGTLRLLDMELLEQIGNGSDF